MSKIDIVNYFELQICSQHLCRHRGCRVNKTDRIFPQKSYIVLEEGPEPGSDRGPQASLTACAGPTAREARPLGWGLCPSSPTTFLSLSNNKSIQFKPTYGSPRNPLFIMLFCMIYHHGEHYNVT